MRRVHLGLTTLVALLAIGTGRAAAAETAPIELPQGTRARALTFGPDGRIWFTATSFGSGSTDLVGSTSLSGEKREYELAARTLTTIGDIVAGSDGHLWFADTARSEIGKVSLDGKVAEFPLSQGSAPEAVAQGPDGAIWFTESKADRVGRIDGNGAISTFALPGGAEPAGLANGPAGALWIAEHGSGRIARMTPDGTASEFPLPEAAGKPLQIARSTDGDLWFSEEGVNRLGRIDTSGHLAEFEVPGNTGGVGGGTSALAPAPDGGVYFVTGTERAGNEIGELSPAGDLTGIGCVDPSCTLPVSGLAVGPEGRLWYATGVRYTGGGGGTALDELHYGRGTIGTFAPPAPIQVIVPAQRSLARERHARILVECKGAQRAICNGVLRLQGRFKLPGWHHPSEAIIGWRAFRLQAETNHRVTVKLTKYGLRLLRLGHGRLRLLAVASVHGGYGATGKIVLGQG